LAASINIPAYSDALVVLGTAGIVVPLVQRWGVNPVIGYLGAGALLGPLGLGSFIAQVPVLYWFTVVDAGNVAGIADLGVVFLLFLIGLELSLERLKAMRRLVFGLGALQVLVSTALIAAAAAIAGLKGPAAIVLGACLALSSTAVVLDLLSKQGRMTTTTGRTSFAVLLAQDLAVVPMLIYISILGADGSSSLIRTILTALLQAAAAVGIIATVGRMVLRPLLRVVAGTHSGELFIAAILFVIVGTGVVAAVAGMSMALGAFVAGLLLAETEFRKAIEATIDPFKGLLLGIFFFTVGMGLDVRELVREPFWLLACVAALIAVKAAVLLALTRLFAIARPAAVETALLLGPAGEFALVGIGLAAATGIMPPAAASFGLALASLTMAAIPALATLAQRIAPRLAQVGPPRPELLVEPAPQKKHAIVVGHGRVGKVVCAQLREHGVPYTATDHDAEAVAEDRAKGLAVYYGDATSTAFLKACGIEEAAGVVVTIHSRPAIDEIVAQVRRLRPDVLIVSRARDADHARHLYAIGVTDAVPETIEASLQLSEAALVGIGVPTGKVIASIHEHRDEVRRSLQTAARAGGVTGAHSVKRKSGL